MEKTLTPSTRAMLVVVSVLIVFAAPVDPLLAGPFAYPDSRGGEIARAYIEAFNSGDADRLSAFEQTYRSAGALEKRSVEDRVARLLTLIGQVGKLTPAAVGVETSTSLSITAHADKANMWLNCTFSLEEETPNKLISIAMMPGSPPEGTVDRVEEWKDLADLLGQIRQRTGVPAIAAAIVKKGAITDIAVVGERWVDSGQTVERNDRFHLGSVTKSMTATMIAALVQKELLSWDFTVGEVLGDMEMRDEYRVVTLEQLLQHRGGFPAYAMIDDDEERRLNSLPGTPRRQREAFVAQVLMEKPEATPGSEMHYSNAGYAIAAVMAERVGSRSWEELIEIHLFEITPMKTGGFGWPATPKNPNQPRGHFEENDAFRPQKFGEYELGSYIAPAGGVHCSIEDLARYAIIHLRGLAGRDKDLHAEIIVRLHTAPATPEGAMRYAAGWAIVDSPEVGEVHTHSGSAGTFFATIELYPEYDTAVVLVTNVGVQAGTAISEEITTLVKRRTKEEK
jgi:CubicO group peptidase (beta-lactamase class C family)